MSTNGTMKDRLTTGFIRFFEKWTPNSMVFAFLLTIVVGILALLFTPTPLLFTSAEGQLSLVDAWVQGAPAVQQPIVVPDRKMSRKARREAERAFAARAAAELEARQARRAQEAAAAQRSFGAAPARAAAPARPAAAARPAAGVPAQAQGFAPVQPAYGAPSGARARHAR